MGFCRKSHCGILTASKQVNAAGRTLLDEDNCSCIGSEIKCVSLQLCSSRGLDLFVDLFFSFWSCCGEVMFFSWSHSFLRLVDMIRKLFLNILTCENEYKSTCLQMGNQFCTYMGAIQNSGLCHGSI